MSPRVLLHLGCGSQRGWASLASRTNPNTLWSLSSPAPSLGTQRHRGVGVGLQGSPGLGVSQPKLKTRHLCMLAAWSPVRPLTSPNLGASSVPWSHAGSEGQSRSWESGRVSGNQGGLHSPALNKLHLLGACVPGTGLGGHVSPHPQDGEVHVINSSMSSVRTSELGKIRSRVRSCRQQSPEPDQASQRPCAPPSTVSPPDRTHRPARGLLKDKHHAEPCFRCNICCFIGKSWYSHIYNFIQQLDNLGDTKENNAPVSYRVQEGPVGGRRLHTPESSVLSENETESKNTPPTSQ